MRTLTFIIVSTFCAAGAFAQQPKQGNDRDSLRRKMAGFYSRQLKLDTARSAQVARIMEDYKTAAKQLTARTDVTDLQKRSMGEQLIADKNRKLAPLLSPDQQAKMIPTTERERKKIAPATKPQNH
jgi:hypothetical protein